MFYLSLNQEFHFSCNSCWELNIMDMSQIVYTKTTLSELLLWVFFFTSAFLLSLGTYKPILASTGCFHPDVPQRQVCPGSRGTSTGCAHPVRAHVLCLHRHAPVSPRLREGEKDQGDHADDGDVKWGFLVSNQILSFPWVRSSMLITIQ